MNWFLRILNWCVEKKTSYALQVTCLKVFLGSRRGPVNLAAYQVPCVVCQNRSMLCVENGRSVGFC